MWAETNRIFFLETSRKHYTAVNGVNIGKGFGEAKPHVRVSAVNIGNELSSSRLCVEVLERLAFLEAAKRQPALKARRERERE